MAELNKSDFENVFNNPTTGLYKDNITEDIEAVDVRLHITNAKDSFVNRLDEMALVSVDTTGSSIILTFGNGVLAYQRRFTGSTPFATPKTIDLAFNTNANHYTFVFEITSVAATLTFDATCKSGDTRYNFPTPLMWTSNEIGIFKVTADKHSSSWILEFSLLPAV